MSNIPIWQQRWNGLYWYNMPGKGPGERKINFSLWRRGLLVKCADGKFYTRQPSGALSEEEKLANNKIAKGKK
jgi:hypothetical protein